jgi:hypothetical protein
MNILSRVKIVSGYCIAVINGRFDGNTRGKQSHDIISLILAIAEFTRGYESDVSYMYVLVSAIKILNTTVYIYGICICINQRWASAIKLRNIADNQVDCGVAD